MQSYCELDNYIGKVDNKFTFVGVLVEHYEEIFKNCNNQTRSNYNSAYNRHILPALGAKIIEELTFEDFENVISAIQRKKAYETNTVLHFRYLIRVVVLMASKKGYCKDVLFGSKFTVKSNGPEGNANITQFVKHRKSLKVYEEHCLFKLIMTDHTQNGALMGLALMFSIGVRNSEACSIKFEDIKPMLTHPNCYCAWVYITTDRNTSRLKKGGKTPNAPRKIPIPYALLLLLQKRKEYLQQLIDAGEIKLLPGQTIDQLPIACKKNDFTRHCSTNDLTAAGRVLLQDINFDESALAFIDRDLQQEEKMYEMGVAEKDPTAYLLRRNLATHLYILGLTEPEIQYIMGHEVEDPYANRNDYSSEDRLFIISEKMKNRPLFNPEHSYKKVVQLSNDDPYISLGTVPLTKLVVNVPKKQKGTLRLRITAAEPGDKIRVSVHCDKPCDADYVITPAKYVEVSRSSNVTQVYQSAYKNPRKTEL